MIMKRFILIFLFRKPMPYIHGMEDDENQPLEIVNSVGGDFFEKFEICRSRLQIYLDLFAKMFGYVTFSPTPDSQ